MSPNVGNFVHDLVEMAKAMETLPQVEAKLDKSERDLIIALDTVQDRELAIQRYKSEIEELNAKVRSLEVERDDASFRVLESEDLAHKALSFAKQAETAAAAVMSLLDPPKPELVKEPEPVATQTEGQSEVPPSAGETQVAALHGSVDQSQVASTQSLPHAVHSIQDTTHSQSESSPAANTGETQDNAGQSPAKSTDVGSTTTETSSAEPSHGPYFGKRYMEVSGLISRHEWHQGGGTDEDYDWRPTAPIASGSY